MSIEFVTKNQILIVDDNPTNLDLLFDYLDSSGYEIFVAEDGQSAVEQAKYAKPDIILLDVMMPGLDGFETCKILKTQDETKDIPVIFMTALSNTGDKLKGFALGAVDYLTKPLQHEEVLARVATHLTLRNLQKELQTQNSQLQHEIVWRKEIEKELMITNQRLQQLNGRLQSELALAREIQLSLLPPPQPNWPGINVLCYTAPAYEVGGDFYTYYPAATTLPSSDEPPRTRFSLAIGDVSGKGMPAALLMTVSLAFLQRTIDDNAANPEQILTELNEALMPYTRITGQNCALAYAEISPSLDEEDAYNVRVANAGCMMPLVRRHTGGVEWVEAFGLPLGLEMAREFGYAETTLTLRRGDLIIFSTDGGVEANNASNEMFGFERFEQTVRIGPQTSVRAMLDHVRAEVATFVQGTKPHDDLTMVIMQV